MSVVTNTTLPDVNTTDMTTALPIKMLTDGPEFRRMHEELMSVNMWPLILIMVFATLGSVGNAAVVYIYWLKWKKSKTRVFILCLGLLDLTNCLFNMPVEIAVLWRPIEFDLHYLCKMSRGCTFVINNTGSLVFVSIAIERLLSVYYPLRSRQLTPKFAKIMCLISFLIASSVSWPSFVFYGSHTLTIPWNSTTYIKGKTCLISDEHEFRTGLILIFTTVLFALLILVFVVLTVLYVMIGRKIYIATCASSIGQEKDNTPKLLSKSIISALTGVAKAIDTEKIKEGKISKSKSESVKKKSGNNDQKSVVVETEPSGNDASYVTKTIPKAFTSRNSRRFSTVNATATRNNTLMMRMVTIAFMLSFTPFLCILVIRYTNPKYYFGLDKAQQIVYQVFLRTYFINSMVNPFIYGFMNRRFRQHVKEMFQSLFCSTCCKKEESNVYRRHMSTVTFNETTDHIE